MIAINAFLVLYLALYLFSSAAGVVVDVINLKHLKRYGKGVPDAFHGIINGEKLRKISQYTIHKTNYSVAETITGKVVFLLIILSGLLPWLTGILKDVYFVVAGLIFFAIPGLLGSIADLPFDYYHVFVIEEKYGFNTRTLKTWLLDLLKSILVTVALGTFLLSMLLVMVKYAGHTWWIWAWLIFFSFQLIMSVLYPTVIAPIFNKFTPLEDSDLSEKIAHLAEEEGLALRGVFQMDATKRSRHTNAYVSGLGKAKRIVLFDSLLEAHKDDEILAVLAHELGHLKRNHIKKKGFIIALTSIGLFYLASKMITWEAMYTAFGFSLAPPYAGLFLVAVLWEPVGFFLSPLARAISRRFEREADHHAFKVLKNTESLIKGLKKMARDNLSNLRPHPLYVWFNYSHPPLLERIMDLEEMGGGQNKDFK